MKNMIKQGLLGFAIGDAMGMPLEFMKREDLKNPVTQMLDSKKRNLPKGAWTANTSMTIATIDSITKEKEININKIANNLIEWINNNKYSSVDKVFKVGSVTLMALNKIFKNNVSPCDAGEIDERSDTNEALMRMLPLVYYFYYKKNKDKDILKTITEVSKITHASEISIMGEYIYVKYMLYLLNGFSKRVSYGKLKKVDFSMFDEETRELYKRILVDDIKELSIDDINSTDKIVDTLEASMWCLLKTNSYSSCIVGAINLGGDSSSIGALSGSMAATIYRDEKIPHLWSDKLLKKNYLEKIADNYYKIFITKDYEDEIL